VRRSSSGVERTPCKRECVGSNPTSGSLSDTKRNAGGPIALGVDERAGCNRAKRLTPLQRDFYRLILREFAQHGRPPGERLVAVAASLGIDVEQALARLAEEDLVHRDSGGEIVVAYPFSGVATAHRVRFDGGAEAFAMCAVDALGIPFMLAEPTEILSRDPRTGDEVTLRVQPGEILDWQPERSCALGRYELRRAKRSDVLSVRALLLLARERSRLPRREAADDGPDPGHA
jgi:hypothetical protein